MDESKNLIHQLNKNSHKSTSFFQPIQCLATAAVRDWENWVPKDQSEQAVKDFVDNMTAKYSIKEDERQFTSGAGSEFSKPSDI